MTFTEAAIEVLRREGKPLHFKKIAEIAVRESLLDHVGKIPYRSNERHPTPSREIARTAARGETRARRREEGEERRGRRYPPPAEVAYEILAGADHPLALAEIAAQGAERFLMPDAFVRDTGALA